MMAEKKEINYSKWLKRFARLFSREPEDRDALIEILRNSEHRNLLDPDALLMIEGALHVSEIQVRDIMVPRVQMIVIENNAEPEDILSVVVESGHSRFPVVGETNDEIVGILLAKDLLNYYADPEKDFDIKDVMRATVFIPESKRLNVLLREFRTSRNHMAIVIDEYTGVAGLVTIEDVIEEIIGEIEDEHDLEEDEVNINNHDNDRYTIRALTPMDDFNSYFETEVCKYECDTVGGLVINAFGHLPKRGETIEHEGFNIKVIRADKRRVHMLLFTRVDAEVSTEEIAKK
ncbi:MAG TPA: CBS domain-containing protein [Thiotrichaceae bacterium]|jgi:magnesium and cobalt transporter|nr:CBS domain-containing protein [Thiotrichaceae bacterium]HIM07383.1 CBS domain-containing protein [Gammaproteobacteria bacterium]